MRDLVRALDYAVMVASGLLCVALVALTFGDVLGRNVLNAPIKGAFEITQMIMAVLIFTALPSVCLRAENVAIDILDRVLPDSLRDGLVRLAASLTAICMGVLGWRLFVMARRFAEDGEITGYLQIPTAPVVFYMAAASLLACAMTLCTIFSRQGFEADTAELGIDQ